MDTIDNGSEDREQSRHPLFALEDALQEFRMHLRACEGKILNDDLALKLSFYLDYVEEAYLALKSDVIQRIVDDHNFRTPSLN